MSTNVPFIIFFIETEHQCVRPDKIQFNVHFVLRSLPLHVKSISAVGLDLVHWVWLTSVTTIYMVYDVPPADIMTAANINVQGYYCKI